MLERCPFCGCEAKQEFWRMQVSETYMQHGSVGCSNNHCGIGFTWYDIRSFERYETSDEERAINQWNRRLLK